MTAYESVLDKSQTNIISSQLGFLRRRIRLTAYLTFLSPWCPVSWMKILSKFINWSFAIRTFIVLERKISNSNNKSNDNEDEENEERK